MIYKGFKDFLQNSPVQIAILALWPNIIISNDSAALVINLMQIASYHNANGTKEL